MSVEMVKAAKDRLAQLLVEFTKLGGANASYKDLTRVLQAINYHSAAVAQPENAGVIQDATRYQWLLNNAVKKRSSTAAHGLPGWQWLYFDEPGEDESISEAIDRLMDSEGKR